MKSPAPVKIKNVNLYVASGTGNTLRLAHWVRDYAQEDNISVHVSLIEHVDWRQVDLKTDLLGV